MKKQYAFLALGILLLALFFPSRTTAQQDERVLIYSKSGEVFPYRAEHIDSIKFLTDKVDLTLNPQVTPHPNGATGAMKLTIGEVGEDVQRILVVLPESYQVAKMNDFQALRLFDPSSPARTGLQIFEVQQGKEYDLTGMQRGYEYSALFLPYDKQGCPGNVKRVNFTVPLGALEGNPNIQVSFSKVTTSSFDVKLEPNSDVKGYFFLCDETNSASREQMMQMMGVPDLKHYVVQFGSDFSTRKPHEGTIEHSFDNFKPGTQYSVFVVLVDKNGQYSDLYENFTVTTTSKGTKETAHVAIEVKDITTKGATITSTPDANCSMFRETVVKKGSMTDEEIIAYLRDTPESRELPYHTDPYTWVWETLDAGTTYYAVALAKNAEGKWGPLAKKEFTTLSEEVQVKLPLEYVAEYNVNPEGTGFVSTHANDVSGYFNYDDAVAKFSNIQIDGKNYHLPSVEEWQSIISPNYNCICFSVQSKYDDVTETVQVGGKKVVSKNDYRPGIEGKAYALRFKGSDFLSAWCYEYTELEGQHILKITVRRLENDSQITIDEIAKASFWQANNEKDIVRFFPASGYKNRKGQIRSHGTYGNFWSSSLFDSTFAWCMYFSNSDTSLNNDHRGFAESVRLFSNE